MPAKSVQERPSARPSAAARSADEDDRRARLARLPPRTRQLVELLARRPELSVVDVSALMGLAVSNARSRLRRAYADLECENRLHLSMTYFAIVGGDPPDDASTAE